ncbi:MAG: nodulation protein S NodS [Euryarchaeota archaeon]|nr:nodulation protein S NodS [Euryarchaeota archaeon]|tara:strand:+ start:557 stop:1174 length:618 start_codon:yes stop_codon:yes gene_type:complete
MRPATEVFSEWAEKGKDTGMESGHFASVSEIIDVAMNYVESSENGFSAIDAGCGNGWVVRLLRARDDCASAIGIDGAPMMIMNAKKVDPEGEYIQADLESWTPKKRVDFVHSMEVMYYLNDIPGFLSNIRHKWLEKGGLLAFGVDHYLENLACHNWAEKVGVRMAMHSESEWCEMVEMAGFEIVENFRAADSNWAGTLAIVARAS